MSKKTLAIVGVGVGALVLGGAIWLLWQILAGGTPIIIKGFGDPAGDVTIDGSPALAQNQKATAMKDHLKYTPKMEQMYVLRDDGSCVNYDFDDGSAAQITLNISEPPSSPTPPPTPTPEIGLDFNKALTRVNLVFDDGTTYKLNGKQYQRYSKAKIEYVHVVSNAATTTCTSEKGNSISCPTDIPGGSGALEIVVYYKKDKPCVRLP